ncbi:MULTISPECIES: trp operon repressor [Vibrio]|uniref:Trp operon repressor homolog n=2 Tax=Vibrio TaxID=662 RepID=A0A7X4LN01_9VIBR|nr:MULTISPECIES: trp operon repressor [Vibrio]MBF8999185.1 trp operon repressor [Vibrio nitrifigilis]MZI94617.1 trp operon repressor [Vibrio eleionomae]
MSQQPEYTEWQQLMALVERAAKTGQHEMLLTMLMTADERDALIARVNIFSELMKGELSQRQISQMLGVGIATITRGSNELKSCSEEDKKVLDSLIKQPEA